MSSLTGSQKQMSVGLTLDISKKKALEQPVLTMLHSYH